MELHFHFNYHNMKTLKNIALVLLLPSFFSGCIGTDILEDLMEERLVIESTISSLKVSETYQFKVRYFNNIGVEESISPTWESSDATIVSINDTGLATALKKGSVMIKASYREIQTELTLITSDTTTSAPTERSTEVNTVSSYPLSGSVKLKVNGNGLILEFADNFNTTSALPGLYVYLSNNTNTISGALEVGAVTKFSGSQTYNISATGDLFKYNYVLFFCKPFVVPVGNGKLNP
jgi:hypothetical protein